MTYIPDKEAFGEYKMLGQLNPASPNTPELLYSPNAGEEVHIKGWTVANQNNQDVSFIFYLDDTGTTWDDTTVVFIGSVTRDQTSPAGDPAAFMNNSAGSIGFEASDVDVTVTIWGVVYDIG